jgi:hypothetical protein
MPAYSHRFEQLRREAQEAADHAQRDATRHERLLETLQARVEKLVLINQALWTFIQETTAKREQDLIERVRQLRQENVEKKARGGAVRQCPNCNRPVSISQERCIFCGSEIVPESAFDQV